jgi:hypothetical protein
MWKENCVLAVTPVIGKCKGGYCGAYGGVRRSLLLAAVLRQAVGFVYGFSRRQIFSHLTYSIK